MRKKLAWCTKKKKYGYDQLIENESRIIQNFSGFILWVNWYIFLVTLNDISRCKFFTKLYPLAYINVIQLTGLWIRYKLPFKYTYPKLNKNKALLFTYPRFHRRMILLKLLLRSLSLKNLRSHICNLTKTKSIVMEAKVANSLTWRNS